MAIKRVMNIELNLKDGAPIPLSGDDAQRVVQAFDSIGAGSIVGGVKFKNASGDTQFVLFSCLCGYTVKATTEETAPDRPCEPVECL